jgi:KUP system potassium uptake protein
VAGGHSIHGGGRPPTRRRLVSLSVATLGVVFGDIGTSPLYAIRESFSGHFGVAPTPANVLGILSLILWSLLSIVTLKYVLLVLQADNEGEGGILALTALIHPDAHSVGFLHRIRGRARAGLVLVGLFGAALLFGDAIITPAISVLGGMEGIAVAAPGFEGWVVPLTVAVLAGLFLFQKRGTARISKLFGPITLVWFIVLSVLGVRGILMAPDILRAINPLHAVDFLSNNGPVGFLALGAVFLVVTGAEALYADLGHFGRTPIQYAWFVMVFPSLVLNYFGQGALVLADPTAVRNPFYLLAPEWALFPLIGLSTAAAVIASQAVISGVFSLSLQVVQLGFWPRLDIRHTSALEYGQIYVPPVNWMLAISTIGIVLVFESSAALAAAYGVAIVCTMIVTTTLLFVVAPKRWNWHPVVSWLLLAGFLVVELGFLAANALKIGEGGWVPLAIAAVLMTMALSWRQGRDFMAERLTPRLIPVPKFLDTLAQRKLVRVPGNAVYMTRNNNLIPTALMKTAEHQKTLHERVVLLTVVTERMPHVRATSRVEIEDLPEGFVKLTVHYGFMDTPDITAAVAQVDLEGLSLPLADTTYFLGRERLMTEGRPVHNHTWAFVFSFMDRNSQRAWAFYNIPPDRVVEIGSQIDV